MLHWQHLKLKMPRYFIRRVRVEGFRGINNEGEPLDLSFDPNCVNSIFAPNALGKSSVFEALSYLVAKLDRLPAADEPQKYYANRFHGTGVATISVVFHADNGSGDVEIEVKRGADGTRTVTSSSGCANPEEFLQSMDSGLALLDHEMFLEFVTDTPLKRGRTFSSLLGLSRLSEFRQVLQVLANSKNVNNDFDIDNVKQAVSREEHDERTATTALRTAYRGFFSQELPPQLEPDGIRSETHTALKAIPLVSNSVPDKSSDDVDFRILRTTIQNAEASDKRERLALLLRSTTELHSLVAAATETTEQQDMRNALQRREQALSATRGPVFQELYSSIRELYATKLWSDDHVCPACESPLKDSFSEQISQKLQQYTNAETELVAVQRLWRTSQWTRRQKSLEEAKSLGLPAEKRKYLYFNSRFNSSRPSEKDLDQALEYLDQLEAQRAARIEEIAVEKSTLEADLPPSLVMLTQQVEFASQIQESLKKLSASKAKLRDLSASLELRQAWAAFIESVSDEFADAEVRLSTARTTALEKDYREMYKQVTSNPEVVPLLKKSPTSEELHLKLAEFYGLKDLSATTLLPESYRNALAICIYLSAVTRSVGLGRFIVLDDVTSSFDAGHQWSVMELIRTKIAYPANPNGPQVIILSHDGLLEKYFDRIGTTAGWHHQRLQGAPPKGMTLVNAQNADHIEKNARKHLLAGQIDQARPLIRQYLEQKLLQIIRKLSIPAPLDFSIRDEQKLVANCIEVIQEAVRLHQKAGDLILSTQQAKDFETVHVPAIVGNWLSHFATAASVSTTPYVLIGILDTIDRLAACFMYSCSCSGSVQPRFYKNLSKKACSC